ncbi:Uncharacterized protein dnm_063500 [Desulfonema magnum]|uniref:Uncharacterized protein n=1 Tax=Desulfonema magnum TaxID=45655 RepID=A0A975BR26_9BACT|nr:Uncharacterized protein dnm_063500 [Desulfonema magnum]
MIIRSYLVRTGKSDGLSRYLVSTLCVTAIKLRLIRGGKKSFRQGCEK